MAETTPTTTTPAKSCVDCDHKHLNPSTSKFFSCTWFEDTEPAATKTWLADRPPWVDLGPKIKSLSSKNISIKQPYIDCNGWVLKPTAP